MTMNVSGRWIAGAALALLAVGVLFQGPIRARCCIPDPESGQRVGALLWADRDGGVPMLGPDGTERRIPYAELRDIRHGACARRIETLTAWQTGTRGSLPLPAARITWHCLVSARDSATGDRLRGVLRLVDDPIAPWAPRDMLAGPDLPARLAALERL